MSRIEPISKRNAGLLARFAYWFSTRKFGKVATPLAVVAHHPQLFRGYGAFEYYLDASKRVPVGLKHLAEIRVATLVGCPY